LRRELRWERANIYGVRERIEVGVVRAERDEATRVRVVEADLTEEMEVFVR